MIIVIQNLTSNVIILKICMLLYLKLILMNKQKQKKKMANKTITQERPVKLIQLYQKSQEEVNIEETQFEVESAQLRLQSDILATQQSLAQAKKALDAAFIAKPFNASNIIEAQKAVEGFEEGLIRLRKLENLF